MAKTVIEKGTFEVYNAAKCQEAKKVINDTASFDVATQHFPWAVAPLSVDYVINMGGVVRAKRIFLRVSQEVTLKLNQNTDTGFPFGPGDMILSSTTGITAIYLTTGANETEVEAIIAGDKT